MRKPSRAALGMRDHLPLLVTTFTSHTPAVLGTPITASFLSLDKHHDSLKTHSASETSVLLSQPAGFGVGGTSSVKMWL